MSKNQRIFLSPRTFAIIGTGFIFPCHFYAIQENGGRILDIANREDTWREMIKSTKAEYIVILTPNDLHYQMIKEAVKAGKKVICEKPMVIGGFEEAQEICALPDVYTVLQLRYHPLARKLKTEIKESMFYRIDMDISVYRDPEYYLSWKGQSKRSGGILYNLGIHYFDLLIWLFGPATTIDMQNIFDKQAEGFLKGKNWSCFWHLTTDAKQEKQRRIFAINDEPYNFSSQDNLSYEDLHCENYRQLLQGQGITANDTLPVIALIEAIKKQ